MTLGDRIREVRGSQSQADFGATIGISQPAVRNYEQGYRQPTSNILNNICNKFGINPTWLLSGEGPKLRKGNEEDEPLVKTDRDSLGEGKGKTENRIEQLQQELMECFREQNRMLRENADLRVQVERDAARIRELERTLEDARRDCERPGGVVGEKSWL